MHSRRRKFGDGGRSNLAEHARISPEGSASGQGQYDSDYRSFNRSYDRGCTTKPYPQLPPPPHRKGDIFMEAGRLAAEYLVSHGMLPPDVLLNRKNVNHCDFRGHDRDYLPPPSEGRTSALARLGNAPDSGSRRRFNDDYGSRHHMKGRRRSESAKGFGSDWGRNGSLSEKLKGFSSSVEGEEEHKGGRHEERSRTADPGIASEKVVTDELPSKNATASDSEPRLDTSEFPDNDDSRGKSPSADEDIVEAEKDAKKAIDDAQSTNLDPVKVKNNACVEEKGQHRNSDEKAFSDDVAMQDRTVEIDKNTHIVKDSLDRHYNDLLNFCTFAKVPTRARSSLASKVTKRDVKSCREEESKLVTTSLDNKELANSEEHVESSLTAFTKQAFGLSGSSSGTGGILSLQSVEGPGELDSVYVLEKQRCARSQSFPDRSSFVQDEHDGQSPPGFARSRSSELPGVEDRLVQHIVCGDMGIKRRRELGSQTDGVFGPLASKAKSSFDNVPGDDEMVDAVDHASQINAPMIQDSKTEQIVEMKEEKRLLPDSFKICDLNFSEASVSESPKNIVPNFESVGPSSLRLEDEAPVDVGLSIGNNFNGNEAGNGSAVLSNQKEIIVVDVDDDDDLVIGNTVFNNTDKRYCPFCNSLILFFLCIYLA